MPGFSVSGQVNESGTEGVEQRVFDARDDRLADWQSDRYVLLGPNAPVPDDYKHDDYHWYGIYDDDGVISVWPIDCAYRYLEENCVPGRYIFAEYGDQPSYFLGTVELLPESSPNRVQRPTRTQITEFEAFMNGPNTGRAGTRARQGGVCAVVNFRRTEATLDIDLDGIEDRIVSYYIKRTHCDDVYTLWLSSEADPGRALKAVSYFIIPSDCQ